MCDKYWKSTVIRKSQGITAMTNPQLSWDTSSSSKKHQFREKNQQKYWNYPKIWYFTSLFRINLSLVFIWVGQRWASILKLQKFRPLLLKVWTATDSSPLFDIVYIENWQGVETRSKFYLRKGESNWHFYWKSFDLIPEKLQIWTKFGILFTKIDHNESSIKK